MIQARKLAKSYGDVTAIRDVSFALHEGEILALLGGNGSGKSTSINILTGLLRADSGTVSIDGIDPVQEPLRARSKIGVFPDKPGLFPNLTVREHLSFFARAHAIEGQAVKEAIDRAVSLIGLEDIIDRKTKGFSQGQTVKTALARAVVHNPKYVILDEPSRGLDVFALRQLRKLLLRLRDEGTGILFSSHVMQEIEILADRLAVISDGVICAEGSATDLKEKTGQERLEDAFMVAVKGG